MMKIKAGAIASNRLEMIKPRKAVEHIFNSHGFDFWLTSGMDGSHGAGSLHYAGYAEDYDSSDHISDEIGKQIEAEVFEKIYDRRYDIIWHYGHLHVEYDPSEFGKYK